MNMRTLTYRWLRGRSDSRAAGAVDCLLEFDRSGDSWWLRQASVHAEFSMMWFDRAVWVLSEPGETVDAGVA